MRPHFVREEGALVSSLSIIPFFLVWKKLLVSWRTWLLNFSAERRLDPLPPRKFEAAEIVDNYIYFSPSGVPLLFITSRIDFARYIICCSYLLMPINFLLWGNCILQFTRCYTFYGSRQMHNDTYPLLKYRKEQFHCPEDPLCSARSSFPPLLPLETTDLFTVSIISPFPKCHVVGIVKEKMSHGPC